MTDLRLLGARWALQVRPWCRLWHTGAQRLGMPGRIGLCMCALALAVWGGALPAQHRQVDELAAHNDWLRQRLTTLSAPDTRHSAASEAPGLGPAAPRALWAQVWQALPMASEAGPRQASLLRAAAETVSEPVSFSHERVKSLPGLSRWRLSVSTTAPWSQQMQWMAHVLAQPAVSIDAVTLQRDQPHDDVWQLRLGLSLWTRVPTTSRDTPQAVGLPAVHKEWP